MDRRNTLLAPVVAVFCVATIAPRPLAAQADRSLKEFVSAAEALDALRSADNGGTVSASQRIRSMLTQANRSYPMAALDSVAEELVRIAIEAHPGDLDAGAATVAIAHAGSAEARVPYHGAFERLAEIYERAASPGRRGAAMRALYDLADKERALQFWAEVARSAEASFLGAQETAVDWLARLGAERGRAILRELHARDLVKEPRARHYLFWLAEREFVLPDSIPPASG